MPNYANGKIYQIISPNYPLPYIGSTTQPLCRRMAVHRCLTSCSSRMVIEAGNTYIELIEDYPCENKEQLNRREGEIIRERECVNRRIPGRTSKEYHQVNRESYRVIEKKYSDTHRETRKTYQTAYRQANREVLNEKKRATYALKINIKSEATESLATSNISQPS